MHRKRSNTHLFGQHYVAFQLLAQLERRLSLADSVSLLVWVLASKLLFANEC